MIAKKRFKNDLVLNKKYIVITPQLNLIIKKEINRRRENLSIINKIALLISKKDSQILERNLVFILKIN